MDEDEFKRILGAPTDEDLAAGLTLIPQRIRQEVPGMLKADPGRSPPASGTRPPYLSETDAIRPPIQGSVAEKGEKTL